MTSTPPDLPDVQVAWLSRAPLYAPYAVDYPDGWTPELRPGTENDKHWPDPGEPITFSAHIANRGTQPTGAFSYRWRMDGNDVLAGTVANLAPGEWITLTMSWRWDQARHWVSLDADVANAVAEVTEQNNRLEEATDALYQDIRVHPYAYEAFKHYQNARGSYNFEDWIQTHYAQLNQRFAQAVYPDAPQGILDRVRINSIRVTTDTTSGLANYDGGWQIDVPRDDPDTPENESILAAEDYAAHVAKGIDWGLIHEVSHQLGMIDLYQLNLEQDLVLLPDKDELPLLMSYACRNCDIMSGGDTSPYKNETYYSSYSAAALNRNYGQRRGYYGEFLFDIPLTNVLVLRDNAGAPLAGAQVQVYQKTDAGLPLIPVISGTSDANGLFILPNRPLSVEITTATGHTLHPNPFGRINVVGTNGELLFKVSRGGNDDYTWHQILDFNLAFWRGMTQTYAIDWPTHLPPLAAPPPLPAMTGRIENGQVSLSWLAQPGASAYRVYKSNEPYYQWDVLDTVAVTAYSATPSWHTRYAVTVLDGSGRESGFGPVYRAFYWVYPSDAVYEQGPGTWLVLDGHSGAVVQLLHDGRVVGNRISVHASYVGGQAMSQSSDGSLAIVQEGQATILNRSLRRSGVIGRTDYEAPRIVQATGVLLAGESFSTTVRPGDDGSTLLLGHFDGDLTASGATPLTATVSFTSGVAGQAVRIGAGDRLAYAGEGRFAEEEGGLDFWLRPEWDASDPEAHVFFSAGDGKRYIFEVGETSGWLYVYIDKFDGYNSVALWANVSTWRKGEWHHVGVSWMPHWLKLYVDGEMVDVTSLRRPITGPLGVLNVGTIYDGTYPALAALDELRVSSIARVGNSDRVHVLVSEESKSDIRVLDLMGNVLAVWSDHNVLRPRGLAARPDGRVAVADTSDGTVKLLTYDGQGHLGYDSTLVTGLERPQNIESDGDRLIVPDYGHGLVKIFSAAGSLQAAYASPNDGYPGMFGGPAATARDPAGNLLVVDKGKRRVTFIWHGSLWMRSFQPVIIK